MVCPENGAWPPCCPRVSVRQVVLSPRQQVRETPLNSAYRIACDRAQEPSSALAFLPDAIRTIEQALQERDSYTGSHSARVSRYATAIAQELRLTARDQLEILLGAELHDIGKIGVPDEVLRKEGRLSAEELGQVQAHPVIGERILRPLLHSHPAVMAVVRWHHERIDGKGYPDGLEGDQIPLAARIVGVADAFDAMTSARPYRPALTRLDAIEELRRVCGTQLDAECVRAFLRALRRDPGLWGGATAATASVRALTVVLATRLLVREPAAEWCGRVRGSRPAERGPPWRDRVVRLGLVRKRPGLARGEPQAAAVCCSATQTTADG